MIREIAIEPELLISWANKEFRREFKPSDLKDSYGLGSPTKMTRYPKNWGKLLGVQLNKVKDPLQRARAEELAKALIENNIKRFEYLWDGEKSWYENAILEHDRLPFEAILCRANFNAIEKVVSLKDFQDENEDKLKLLKIPHGLAPIRSSDALISAIGPWLFHCETVVIVDPYFNPNRLQFREPLLKLISEVLSKCSTNNYPNFRIIRKHDANAPSLAHLLTGFEQYIAPYLPVEFEIHFLLLEEIQGGEKLHNRYILSEIGGVRIDPGFDIQDDPNGNETYDLNLLEKDQYLKRWDQYYISNDAFELKVDQLIITNQGI